MELTNALRKQIQSLNDTKHRRALRLFKAEGTKCVLDTIEAFDLQYLIATQKWLDQYKQFADNDQVIRVSPREMERLTSFSTASQVIAVYNIPDRTLSPEILDGQLSIALDCLQDPGNLGTIIRTADWFGIRNIIATRDTVDMFSPKVVQATMGAISRVNVYYCDLVELLSSLPDMPVYGTFLDGENLFSSDLTSSGIIIMGNEGKGISENVAAMVNRRLFIPSFPYGESTSESLNVATATAITVAEFRRRLG